MIQRTSSRPVALYVALTDALDHDPRRWEAKSCFKVNFEHSDSFESFPNEWGF